MLILLDKYFKITCVLRTETVTTHLPINIITITYQLLSEIHKLFYLSGEFCILRKKWKANGAYGAYKTINYFACNFAKCSPILQIPSQQTEW